MKILLKEQEVQGEYLFTGQVYMTKGFQESFGEDALFVVLHTMALIKERVDLGIADYLQVAFADEVIFWVIDDVDHITFLMPQDY